MGRGMVFVSGLLVLGCGSDGSGADASSSTDDGGDAAEASGSDGASSADDDATGDDPTDDDAAGTGDGESGDGGPVGDCGSPGWQSFDLAWGDLNIQGAPEEGGVSVCAPEPWRDVSNATNSRQLHRGAEAYTSLSLGAGLALDHARAVQRLVDNASAWCSALDSTIDLAAVDGWPAIQHRYTFDAPICGECPDSEPYELYAVSTYVAAGSFVINIVAQTAVPPDPDIVDELLAIGLSTTVTEEGTPDPAQTAADFDALDAQIAAACGG